MDLKKSISVLGCGWLGFPLANLLVSRGYSVNGSTTTADKLQKFAEAKIVPYLVQFNSEIPPENLSKFLQTDILVIAIPPGRKNQVKNNSFRNMATLVSKAVSGSSIIKIIFISSTSVYGDINTTIDEYTSPSPENASGELLLEVERMFSQIANVQVSILRLSGLIGPDRHPARFFAGKENIPNGLAPINLIHLDDVIGIILKLIEEEDTPGIFIGSCPDHPVKEKFYTWAAQHKNLPTPTFRNELLNWKIIDGEQTARNLNYNYVHTDLMKWISES